MDWFPVVLYTLFLIIFTFLFVPQVILSTSEVLGRRSLTFWFVRPVVIPISTELIVVLSQIGLTVNMLSGRLFSFAIQEEFEWTLSVVLSGVTPDILREIILLS